jgi:pilus assembly protein CpaF
MDVQIVIRAENGESWSELVPASGSISIGRHQDCVVRLDSDLVSRQHVVVDVSAAGVRVEDTSRNGTLAGTQLLRHEFADVPFGTPIVVGDFTVAFFRPDRVSTPPRANGKPRRSTAVDPALRTQAIPAANLRNGAAPAMLERNTLPPPGKIERPAPSAPAAVRPKPITSIEDVQQMPLVAEGEERKKQVALRREMHKLLLDHLDLATVDAKKLDDPSLRPKVLAALRRIVGQLEHRIPPEIDRDGLVGELADEALGLGPLERFLADPTITEIMVVDPNTIYFEQKGKLHLSPTRFTDDERVRAVIERIVTPLGRRIDESSPLVDARLKDGSRVNAVIKPIALRGSCITIRKFSKIPLTIQNYIEFGSITQQMATFLERSVIAKKNIVISGGTGSGKTTLLNILSGSIPDDERVVTIEDAAELQLKQPHVVSLETRPPNLEGRGEYTIRDLVKNALRMRPDRIVVGECRGGEALDMLQAMNTGHDGSLTTTHANSPKEAIGRLETLVLMSGLDLPVRAIREQLAAAVHIIVQQSRMSDGSRRITHIAEVEGIDRDSGEITTRNIFQYVRTGTGEKGKVLGEFRATGYLPSFINEFVLMGLVKPGEPYL